MTSLKLRIQRVEVAAKAQSRFPETCICFPPNEPPVVGFPVELEIATKVKCPLHGDRFKPQLFVYRSKWLRRKLTAHLETHHSKQYRKAWFASFPPELWPATEEEDGNGRIILRLKDGSVAPATG